VARENLCERVKVDPANDLAVLKADGKFEALPVATSRAVKLGSTVVTVGFPNIGLQGFAPKVGRGEIASLSGLQDDARSFQISVPLQPGNSGGALVNGGVTWRPRECATLRKQAQKFFLELEIRCSIRLSYGRRLRGQYVAPEWEKSSGNATVNGSSSHEQD